MQSHLKRILDKLLTLLLLQYRDVPHGTQLQVECNVCQCVDGTMTCTDNHCGVDTGDKEGCELEGKTISAVVIDGFRSVKKKWTCLRNYLIVIFFDYEQFINLHNTHATSFSSLTLK